MHTAEQREQARNLILERIDIGPIDLEEGARVLDEAGLPLPHTLAKCTFWDLAEKALAEFNNEWNLQGRDLGWDYHKYEEDL